MNETPIEFRDIEDDLYVVLTKYNGSKIECAARADYSEKTPTLEIYPTTEGINKITTVEQLRIIGVNYIEIIRKNHLNIPVSPSIPKPEKDKIRNEMYKSKPLQ